MLNIKQLFIVLLCVLVSTSVIYSQDDTSDIKFSVPAGFYESTINVSISGTHPDASIYLTSNGSEPVISSYKYTSAFRITKTTVVKARLFKAGIPVSKTVTATYFINENTNLPVFSLSTHPGNFFNPDTGIYEMGPNPGNEYPYFNANFWKEWERPVHIEYFETDGKRVIDMDAGVKIFGAWSRALPEKSLALFARKKYGEGKIRHKFFENIVQDEFESVVLRNAGNDWNYSMMRDAVMQGIVSELDIDKQAYRPVVVFINGNYWGIHDLREKVNENFLAAHNNVNPDSLDILESDAFVVQGSNSHYKSLISFISSRDLNISQNYEYVKLRMDVDNFINYEIAQIYFDNGDWPGNNIKFWRPQRNDGRWRWILYDTDFGFGLWNNHAYSNNTLTFATANNGPNWPNPPWSTLLLRKLLTNQEFKNSFISRFSELSNTIFKADVVVNRIRKYRAAIEPEMVRHLQRWGSTDFDTWIQNVNDLESFAKNRVQYMRVHFATFFNLNETRLLTINVDNPESGSINFNAVNVSAFPFTGSFYKGIPLTITAIPSPGYVFKRWKGIEGVAGNTFTFSFPIHLTVSPLFVPDTSGKAEIVINEINYNSAAGFDCEDWIEIYNNSDTTVDLSGWMVKDENEDNTFTIPQGTFIPGNGYVVLCSDTTNFVQWFSDVKNKTGDLGFSISNGGELIRIYDNKFRLIDSVRFSDKSPWPSEPDGSGSTLSLRNPSLDNYLAENWSSSSGHGTPGEKNDVFSEVSSGDTDMLNQFYLNQNYPNPFNSTTQIRYSVAKAGNVKLTVFDVLGRQVYVQDEGLVPPGVYRITVSADNLSSGIYYYRLSEGNNSITKKMILLR